MINGVINIDKPRGLTSMDVVRKVKRAANLRKAGHGGTLDPAATGVIPVALGLGTRLLEYILMGDKSYRAVIELGICTDTYDTEGVTTSVQDYSHVGITEVVFALQNLKDNILQSVPKYSALKLNGMRMYDMARKGVPIQQKKRPAILHDITLVSFESPYITTIITCGKGFYVRSLAHDLGEMLGCGAHLSELRRTKAGPFILKDAVPLEYALQCLSIGDPQKVVLDADLCIPEFPKMQLDSYQIDLIRHGRKIINDKITGEMNKDSLVRAYQNDGKFVAILKQTCNTNEWQPKKVFCS